VETTGAEMNETRLRMTRIPKGADLILNKVSGRLASGSVM
jgi:molybdopterin-biosynthesis enzyme MoeA-like protein